ncbi:Glu-tRNA(Gln) amidotransferase subunit GatE [Candidatus Pacearchaeota archaeon]|nr:Glu-tRNA(Gln) amidotransferase subunit GatE [Candidatus Pacearchaeota archaeon]
MAYDYSKLGFKAGLEVHQQIDIGSKLFCHCPAFLRNDSPDKVIFRKLHSVAGETGVIDEAVSYESNLDKNFFYEGYKDNSCLVEYDDSPPYEIDNLALNEALTVALLLNCEIYPVTQVMRKTVIDGSNTSGFQRTVLIAHDGFIETSLGKVRIATICLEEDSARVITREKNKVVYRLDRLGIPLVEIATYPDIVNAEQVKECALKLGEILRACKVKRGIGTIRQDVNISIKGHDRVEIKGFQDPKMMVKTVDFEIERQVDDLKNGKKEGGVRNALPDGASEFLRPMPGADRMYPETDLALLRIGKHRIDFLKKNLPRLKTDIRDELRKKGVSGDLIELVLDSSEILDEFQTLIKVYSIDANLIAKMVTLWRQELASKLKRSFFEVKNVLSERVYEQVLKSLLEGKISALDIKPILIKILDGVKVSDALKIEKVDDDEIENEVRKLIKEKPGMRANAYMGMLMAKFKGKLDTKKAMELINRVLS